MEGRVPRAAPPPRAVPTRTAVSPRGARRARQRHNPADGGPRPQRGQTRDRIGYRPAPGRVRRRSAAASAARRCATSSSTSACRRCARASSRADAARLMEPFYPLRTSRLRRLLPGPARRSTSRPRTIFTEYAYFSSYSDSWVEHARRYAEAMSSGSDSARSLVVELASNDGYLLQHFVAAGIPVLGIEPAANVAGGRDRAGHPDRASSSSGRPSPADLVDRRPARRPARRATMSWPRCPISTTSSPG